MFPALSHLQLQPVLAADGSVKRPGRLMVELQFVLDPFCSRDMWVWQRVLSWERVGSRGLVFPNLDVSISESLPGPEVAFGITPCTQLCCFCANTKSSEPAPRASTVLCWSALGLGAVWDSLLRTVTPPCPSPPSETCTQAKAGRERPLQLWSSCQGG